MDKRVLLVEDEPDIGAMYAQQLALSGFEVTIATDGLSALSKASIDKPHLILLDILLPEMDGLSVLQRLKSDSKTANIPVIMLSNLNQVEQQTQCLKMGAIAYLVKAQMVPSELVKKVLNILS